MSGEVNGPITSAMSAEQTGKLLDEVVYERVLGCIDLDALFRFEQELWLALGECDVDDDEVAEVAKQMIDRALARVGDDSRRYFQPMERGEPFDACELCEEEARKDPDRRLPQR